MWFRKKNTEDDKKINYTTLNEVIKIGRDILKVLLVAMIVAIVVLFSYILKEWQILSLLRTILTIISPLFIGIVIAWLLDPLVHRLTKTGLNRILSSIVVFVIFLAILIVGGTFLFPALANQISEIISSTPKVIDNVTEWFNDFFTNLSNTFENYDFTSIKDQTSAGFTELLESITVDLPTKIVNIVKAFLSGSVNFLLGIFIGFYMLLDFNNIRKHLLNLIPKVAHKDVITVSDKLNDTLKSYVQGTLLIIFLLFICQSIGFTLAGLKAPLVFGLFCSITNIIPYVGPYIGGIPAVIVGFTISPLTGLFTLIAVVVCQFLESYCLNPIVMSKTMKLHPVTIMIGLLIFAHFFGILGMVLSTPIISCGKIILLYLNDKFDVIQFSDD